ncbi:unnamed protein product [Cylindrotheca closterium]|uniref:B30.2/SPRY domain-containing protein n=1 Tax=Cylindrotheca closterium TaxID=2856 RepID=A0AAD2FSP3_9STRA|nr:unnamed protein product [Cylindrotheca closterium]
MKLSSLSTDAQIDVFSFLDLDSLRRMMATDRSFRCLLLSDTAYQMWLYQFELRWGKLPQDMHTDPVLKNDVPLPGSISASESFPSPVGRLGKTNLPLLLSTTPEEIPQRLIQYFYHPGATFDVSTKQTPRLEYSFNVTGYVYSIRANLPLPKPKCQISEIETVTETTLMDDGEEVATLENELIYEWRPFVSPYRYQAGPKSTINVSPRLVSYFEIAIGTRQWDCPPPLFRDDCVCIGLTTSPSRWVSKLPGWDKLSFGYHGDNGGLYHGSGRNIGLVSTFGPGDTVGMGIDYVHRYIFVTKNGQFVTAAFRDLSIDMLANIHFFPIVGLYTSHVVEVNYMGMAQPFCFDLAAYCNRDQEQVTLAIEKCMEQDASALRVGHSISV